MGLFAKLVAALSSWDQEGEDRHSAILSAIKDAKDAIMAELDDKLAELNTKLDQVTSYLSDMKPEVDKIAAESQSTLDALQQLASNPQGGLSADQTALLNNAMDKVNAIASSAGALKDSLQAIDDKVPDNPPPAG